MTPTLTGLLTLTDGHQELAEVARKALSHPIRVVALAMMEHGPTSASDIAEKIDADLRTVAYHVRSLRDLGVIEKVKTVTTASSVERFYSTRRPGWNAVFAELNRLVDESAEEPEATS